MLPRLCNICHKTVYPSIIKFSKYSSQAKLHPSPFDESAKDYYRAEKSEKTKVPIIVCKIKEFNFHKGQTYRKLDPVPLASKGWQHRKSKGDYFTIYPVEEDSQNEIQDDVTFADLGVHDDLISNLKNYYNIEKPTTIQQMGIPKISSYHSTKLTAETGCGKTFAYLLPLIGQVLNWKSVITRKFNHPLALIITPSRELAIQIGREAKKLTRDIDVRTRVVLGGSIKQKLLNPPANDVDIVVASFGGLSKHVTLGIYKMKFVRHVVLDEADSLFDETFYDKLRHFLKKIRFGPRTEFTNDFPKYSQLTLVSATMPQHVEEILEEIIDPTSLTEVSTDKLHHVFVVQKFLRLGPQEKPMTLLKFVKKKAMNKSPIIIFTNDSATCYWVSNFLNEFNVSNIPLNGQMSVSVRKGKFEEFQSRKYNVLCTTDAGSRGLDTVDVKDVINYDFPLQTAEYIHRCGRTGRAGSPKDCRVINFISRRLEILLVQKIEKAVRLMKPIPICDYLKQNWVPEEEDEELRNKLRKNHSEKDLKSVIEEPDNDSYVNFEERN